VNSAALGFIGSGAMAEALIRGLLETRTYQPQDLAAFDVNDARLQEIGGRFNIQTQPDLARLVKNTRSLLLAVKPQQAAGVLSALRPLVDSERHVVISIVAGLPIAFIENALQQPVPVVRTMPNTPARLRAGATVFCLGRFAGDPERKLAQTIFASVGLAVESSEPLMNAVTALSGSGPAYIFRVCEAMMAAGQDLGLSPELARTLTVQTIVGAARMLAESGQSAAELRTAVTSPGGTTEAALQRLDDADLMGLFRSALRDARDRAQALTPAEPKA
jgi:pyrroline-5-carboxylate reductase